MITGDLLFDADGKRFAFKMTREQLVKLQDELVGLISDVDELSQQDDSNGCACLLVRHHAFEKLTDKT